MSPADNIDLSNERLVAYIDGELGEAEHELISRALTRDAEARQRLEVLKRGSRPFGDAFDLLLDAAPDDRLQAMFNDILRKSARPSPISRPVLDDTNTIVPMNLRRNADGGVPLWQLAVAATILALVFTGGLAAGGFFNKTLQVTEQKRGWREAAAQYVALFSKETLEYMPTDPQQRQANLRQLETVMGLKLSADRIADPALSFQGSQLLQLDGKPLAQIAYLRNGETPVALCITRTSNGPATPVREQRHGLNIIHWVANGYGFMVIGAVPEPELEQIANNIRTRFS
jgi:anti-sigma factor RsiW